MTDFIVSIGIVFVGCIFLMLEGRRLAASSGKKAFSVPTDILQRTKTNDIYAPVFEGLYDLEDELGAKGLILHVDIKGYMNCAD